jgi:hypothetical protein
VLEALGRDLQAAQYRADRAARQYEATDPVNRLVAQELERRWNVALEEVKDLEARIRSENASQEAAKVGTADEMRSLADDLEAVWNNPDADDRTKKRLLRALIREVIVDIDETTSEVALVIHWHGGVHTPLRLPRRKRGQNRSQTPNDVIEAVRVLSRICNDNMIAGVLNLNYAQGPRRAAWAVWGLSLR